MQILKQILKQILTILAIMVLVVCTIGGAATLFFVDVPSSNFFAVGVLLQGVLLGDCAFPTIKNILSTKKK